MSTKDTVTLGNLALINRSLLTVGLIAKKLGVHPDTIRRWEKQGQIKCIRHPVNNYRLFEANDLKAEEINERPNK